MLQVHVEIPSYTTSVSQVHVSSVAFFLVVKANGTSKEIMFIPRSFWDEEFFASLSEVCSFGLFPLISYVYSLKRSSRCILQPSSVDTERNHGLLVLVL